MQGKNRKGQNESCAGQQFCLSKRSGESNHSAEGIVGCEGITWTALCKRIGVGVCVQEISVKERYGLGNLKGFVSNHRYWKLEN